MHNTVLAEWTLARFIGKPHASAILGDLEEASSHKSAAWFWGSYLRVVLACAWRPSVAYLAIVLAGDPIGRTVNAVFLHSAKLHPPTQTQQIWLGAVLSVFTTMLSGIALYSCLRFGPKDIVAKATVAATLIGIAGMAFWWQPFLRVAIYVAISVLLSIGMSSHTRRRGLVSLAIMTLFQPLVFFILFFGMAAISIRLDIPPSQTFTDIVLRPAFTLLVCATFGRVHRTFQEHKQSA